MKQSSHLPLRKVSVIGWASTKNKVMSKQTAVDFLAERYNYVTWMRNREEISAGTADQWRAEFLKEAKEMEKEQIVKAHLHGVIHKFDNPNDASDNYYNETFGDGV